MGRGGGGWRGCSTLVPMSHPQTQDPAGYPWAVQPRSCWVYPGGVRPVQSLALTDVEHRIAILAVGSNAAPRVLHRKLGTLLDDEVAIQPVAAAGMLIGHSAHISTPGYIPAAPALSEEDGVKSVITWLTPDQATAIDATEPNYRRTPLPPSVQVSTSGEPVDPGVEVYVYDSIHGVLGADGTVLPLTSQPEILTWLSAQIDAPLEPADLTDPQKQATVREAIARHSLAMPSGFATETG